MKILGDSKLVYDNGYLPCLNIYMGIIVISFIFKICFDVKCYFQKLSIQIEKKTIKCSK